jgi:hypothetical protein
MEPWMPVSRPGLHTVTALRYVQPLREGGSLPAVVDTDAGIFVVKFKGAGQGPKALVAELIVGLIAAEIGLPVPEIVLVDVGPIFGRSEPDPEIQDLLRASHGINVGLRYLDGAFNFALAVAGDLITPEFASRLVWLDAFVTNPDRTHRNPNILVWHRQPWLIDNGAALYAHHDWSQVDEARTRSPFPLIREHVLLGMVEDPAAADRDCTGRLPAETLRSMLSQIPDALLVDQGVDVGATRARYLDYLTQRMRPPREFVAEIARARAQLLADPRRRLSVRR